MSEINITEYIPFGRDNGVRGWQLAIITGLTERQVRRAVNDARRKTVILNMQDGAGYFQPTEEEESLVSEWLHQEESRLKVHALALRSARERVRNEK